MHSTDFHCLRCGTVVWQPDVPGAPRDEKWRIIPRSGAEEERDDMPEFPKCPCGCDLARRDDPLCPKCLSPNTEYDEERSQHDGGIAD
jgi:hypothetical protein